MSRKLKPTVYTVYTLSDHGMVTEEADTFKLKLLFIINKQQVFVDYLKSTHMLKLQISVLNYSCGHDLYFPCLDLWAASIDSPEIKIWSRPGHCP